MCNCSPNRDHSVSRNLREKSKRTVGRQSNKSKSKQKHHDAQITQVSAASHAVHHRDGLIHQQRRDLENASFPIDGPLRVHSKEPRYDNSTIQTEHSLPPLTRYHLYKEYQTKQMLRISSTKINQMPPESIPLSAKNGTILELPRPLLVSKMVVSAMRADPRRYIL